MMSDSEKIAYLAGFFDGEGCIRVICNRAGLKLGQNASYSLAIIATQKSQYRTPLLMLKEVFGGSICATKVPENCQPIDKWTLCSGAAAEALRKMLPYLTVKRAQALAGLAFHEFKEMVWTVREKRTRIQPWEVDVCEEFTHLFYILNGNQSLSDLKQLVDSAVEIGPTN